MKTFEKLESVRIQNEKLSFVKGGANGITDGTNLHLMNLDPGGSATGAGECNLGFNGQTISYSSDFFYDDGGYKYYNVNGQ